jgi:DNA-binding protein HU-beta
MNKNELAVQMVKDSSITKSDAMKVIDAFVDVVTIELKKKDAKITLVGFGTFKTIEKKQKKGRNPRTGAVIIIPKKKVVKFVAGKQLKDIVK